MRFDLPSDPELLEQRIGRLDRIGQTATIRIHVPYIRRTESELLARWYHEGLNAFEENLHGATEIVRSLREELEELADGFDEKSLTAFLEHSRTERAKVVKKLERGHDRLLELSSCRTERAEEIMRQIGLQDADLGFEQFLIELFDHFGLHTEDLEKRGYLLLPGHLITDAFPALPPEGMSATLDRTRALSRDDLNFLTSDHPLVRSSLDLLLGSESGNSSFGIWKDPAGEAVFLEVHYVVEAVAPAALHVDRFLPATPIRIAVDHAGNDLTADEALQLAPLEKGDVFRLLDRGAVRKKIIPAMIAKSQELANAQMALIVEGATRTMESQLQGELDRLEDLKQVNDHIRPEELAHVREHQEQLRAVLKEARLRTDAIRLIFRTA